MQVRLRSEVVVHPPSGVNYRGDLKLYLGPDTLMPVASVFAAVAGFILMFWRKLVGALKSVLHRLTGRPTAE